MADEKESSQLKERWLAHVQRSVDWLKGKPNLAPSAFEAGMNDHIRSMATKVAKRALQLQGARTVDVEHLQRSIKEAHAEKTAESAQYRPEFITSYAFIHKRLAKMVDEKKQEVWATTTDRLIALAFRMLTAIGIAAVVLATAAIADRYGINLPMVRAAGM